MYCPIDTPVIQTSSETSAGGGKGGGRASWLFERDVNVKQFSQTFK